jgi:hypothetical protein
MEIAGSHCGHATERHWAMRRPYREISGLMRAIRAAEGVNHMKYNNFVQIVATP